jgi:hypothetical protein
MLTLYIMGGLIVYSAIATFVCGFIDGHTGEDISEGPTMGLFYGIFWPIAPFLWLAGKVFNIMYIKSYHKAKDMGTIDLGS